MSKRTLPVKMLAIGMLVTIASGPRCPAVHAEENPLATFHIREGLNHQWTNEVVHFDFDIDGTSTDLMLVNARGKAVTSQLADVQTDKRAGRTHGKVWTVLDLAPGESADFHLRNGKSQPPTDLTLTESGRDIELANDQMALTISRWETDKPIRLTQLPPPFRSVRRDKGAWLAAGSWVNAGEDLTVVHAKTTIEQNGPVRALIHQRAEFAEGGIYEMSIELGARQEVAVITEYTTVEAPAAGFRLSFWPGLKTDHVYHMRQMQTQEMVDDLIDFKEQKTICRLRPWSYWWMPVTMFCGFHGQGDDFVGLVMLDPGQWSIPGWTGFQWTEVPVIARPEGQLDVTFRLLAVGTGKDTRAGGKGLEQNYDAIRTSLKREKRDNLPLTRRWAVTAAVKDDHVKVGRLHQAYEDFVPRLRTLLVKHGEFPLDEVKDIGLNLKADATQDAHPFLLITPEDLQRVRRHANDEPHVMSEFKAARYNVDKNAFLLEEQGEEAFLKRYKQWGLEGKVSRSYLCSDNPIYGRMLAAIVKEYTRMIRQDLLYTPRKSSLGRYGPWFTYTPIRALFRYDLIAGQGLLSPEDERLVRNTLIFSLHALNHEDYWNPGHGLATANPNMSSMIDMASGMLALFIKEHPKSDQWLAAAESELLSELNDLVQPEGAFIECPGYQLATLDGMFMLAQALRNVKGRDHFSHPRFKAMMEHFGFLLTPPDPRFPQPELMNSPAPSFPGIIVDDGHPMTLPSVGDTFAGRISMYNGWMARAMRENDPDYAARQQFYWARQVHYSYSRSRPLGMGLGLVDPQLPESTPQKLDGGFPGFGSIMRTSWTDPNASYVAHRAGRYLHHYQSDWNSFVFYAKGAPLVGDFGNYYLSKKGQPRDRREGPWKNNAVSFGNDPKHRHLGASSTLVDFRSLRHTAAWSHGRSICGKLNKGDDRHLLFVKSDDPLGANYVVIRDKLFDRGGLPDKWFHYNLWCYSEEPKIERSSHTLIHFPGQFGVDLDLHVLSPSDSQIKTESWDWDGHIYVWGPFKEKMHGVHVGTPDAEEDFLTLLFPRAAGQAACIVKTEADGRIVQVRHMQGVDRVLISPDEAVPVAETNASLTGKIAMTRHYNDGRVRLAVLLGDEASASDGDWKLTSSGPTAITIADDAIHGESHGEAHETTISLPRNKKLAQFHIDDRQAQYDISAEQMHIQLPAGYHTFTIQLE